MVEINLSDGCHTPSSHVAYGSEGAAEAGEEKWKKREELGVEGSMECWSNHLQDLERVHYCLSCSHKLLRYFCGAFHTYKVNRYNFIA